MAPRLQGHAVRSPRDRVVRRGGDEEGYLYPGEVAELLGCQRIDYAQMRRLLRLVRGQAGSAMPGRKWARYTLRDVAALNIAIDLCGGLEALERGRHLHIRPVEAACAALRRRGVDNPLLDVVMRRSGDAVYAEIDGLLVDPVRSEVLLGEAEGLLRRYLGSDHLHADGQDVASALHEERERSHDPQPLRYRGGVRIDNEFAEGSPLP